MSLNKFTYHFTLAKNKKNKLNLCPIYLRIIVDGKRTNLSTNKAILEKDWINSAGVLTTIKETNIFLASLERKLITLYNKLTNADKEITAKILKDSLLGIEEKKHTFIKTLEFHNEEMRKMLGVKYAICKLWLSSLCSANPSQKFVLFGSPAQTKMSCCSVCFLW